MRFLRLAYSITDKIIRVVCCDFSVVRQQYIASGGKDPQLLDNLSVMLAEALEIEIEKEKNKRPQKYNNGEKQDAFICARIFCL